MGDGKWLALADRVSCAARSSRAMQGPLSASGGSRALPSPQLKTRQADRTYDRKMQVWVEVPDEWGWGPIRILRGRLEDNGYHTEEYRMARGVMIQVTGSKPAGMADPPQWQGWRARP